MLRRLLYFEYKLLSFFDLIKFFNIVFVYQLINRQLPFPLSDTFEIDSLSINARNSNNRYPTRLKSGILQLPRVCTVQFGNNSIRYQSVVSWNILQHFLSIDDMSSLTLNRLKHLAKASILPCVALQG